jgi:hypothetical protein
MVQGGVAGQQMFRRDAVLQAHYHISRMIDWHNCPDVESVPDRCTPQRIILAECPDCKGRGYYKDDVCRTCDGSGDIEVQTGNQ